MRLRSPWVVDVTRFFPNFLARPFGLHCTVTAEGAGLYLEAVTDASLTTPVVRENVGSAFAVRDSIGMRVTGATFTKNDAPGAGPRSHEATGEAKRASTRIACRCKSTNLSFPLLPICRRHGRNIEGQGRLAGKESRIHSLR